MKTRHVLLFVWAAALLFCEFKLYQPEEAFPWQPGKMIGVLFGFLIIFVAGASYKVAGDIIKKYFNS